jgi:hypothetical protein
MKRRDYISLIGARWPLAACAQQRPIPRIGVIAQSPIWDHFRRGLNELGYLDGRDIVIEYRSAQGQPDRLVDRLGRSLQDLVGSLSELHALKIDLSCASRGSTPRPRRGRRCFR